MLGFLKYWAKEFGPHPEGTGESQMVLEQEISLMHIMMYIMMHIRIDLAYPMQELFAIASLEAKRPAWHLWL